MRVVQTGIIQSQRKSSDTSTRNILGQRKSLIVSLIVPGLNTIFSRRDFAYYSRVVTHGALDGVPDAGSGHGDLGHGKHGQETLHFHGFINV